jgi:alpha-beta hydrolase superfamily lysophospholipase
MRHFMALTVALTAAACMPASWGASALLYPSRRPVQVHPKRVVQEVDLEGAGVRLRTWWFTGEGQRRGTVVYLHGVGDNRGSSVSIADRLVPKGFDVIAYDSRAHGASTGDACTYGYHEKRDLARVLDGVSLRPIVVMGASLGAAVALQAAAEEARIDGVVSIATFSDLRTAVAERAPFFASKRNIDDALALAERKGAFEVDQVSPVAAAVRIQVPVLLVHGAADRETPPAHSRRVAAALGARGRLLIVPGAGHNDALTAETWREIEAWLSDILAVSVQTPR